MANLTQLSIGSVDLSRVTGDQHLLLPPSPWTPVWRM